MTFSHRSDATATVLGVGRSSVVRQALLGNVDEYAAIGIAGYQDRLAQAVDELASAVIATAGGAGARDDA